MSQPASSEKQPAPPINPTPKQRFQTLDRAVAEHHFLVDSVPFRRAVDYAMLQYQHQLSEQVRDGNTAASAGFKLQGALEFLAQLRGLGDTRVFSHRAPTDNLDHRI